VAAHYFDSSALVKRYVGEIGSAWVLGVTAPAAGNDLFIARITAAEVVSALVRKVPPLAPPFLARALDDFKYDYHNQYQNVEITERVMSRAMALAEAHRLRGYDAVQLAVAVELQALRISSTCRHSRFSQRIHVSWSRLAAEGLPTENPNLHP